MGDLSPRDSGRPAEFEGVEDSWFSIADMQVKPVLHRLCVAGSQGYMIIPLRPIPAYTIHSLLVRQVARGCLSSLGYCTARTLDALARRSVHPMGLAMYLISMS